MSRSAELATRAVGALVHQMGDLGSRLEHASLALSPILSVQAGLQPAEAAALKIVMRYWQRSNGGTIRTSISLLSETELHALADAILDFYKEALRKDFWNHPRDPQNMEEPQ